MNDINSFLRPLFLLFVSISIFLVSMPNVADGERKEFAISDIEESGLGGSRYISITDAVPMGHYKIQSTGRIQSEEIVIFPVASISRRKDFLLGPDKSNASPIVYIRRHNLTQNGENCVVDNDYCIKNTPTQYSGYVQSLGWYRETAEAFQKLGYTIPENIILLSEGSGPSPNWGWLILAWGSLIFSIIFLKSLYNTLKSKITQSK